MNRAPTGRFAEYFENFVELYGYRNPTQRCPHTDRVRSKTSVRAKRRTKQALSCSERLGRASDGPECDLKRRTYARYRTPGYLPNLVIQNVFYIPLEFRLRLLQPTGAVNLWRGNEALAAIFWIAIVHNADSPPCSMISMPRCRAVHRKSA